MIEKTKLPLAAFVADNATVRGHVTAGKGSSIYFGAVIRSESDTTAIGEDTNILSFEDASQLSDYAIPAMQWAVGAGVINGTAASTLSPRGDASRAQVANILYRFLSGYQK